MNIEVNDIEHYVFSYTGHEHLLEFKIINMNGRMYDPVLGRMLLPDNYVQDPYGDPMEVNRIKWWEHMFSPVLFPFMWAWN